MSSMVGASGYEGRTGLVQAGLDALGTGSAISLQT